MMASECTPSVPLTVIDVPFKLPARRLRVEPELTVIEPTLAEADDWLVRLIEFVAVTVAPFEIESALDAIEPERFNVPAETVVAPESPFVPESVSVPLPVFVNEPCPLTAPSLVPFDTVKTLPEAIETVPPSSVATVALPLKVVVPPLI